MEHFSDHIKSISVFNGVDYDEIPRDEMIIEGDEISFKLWSNLELSDYIVESRFLLDSEEVEISSIEGRVLNEVVLIFDFDTDAEYFNGGWFFEVKSNPLKVEVTSFAGENQDLISFEEIEDAVLYDILNDISIEQEEFDILVE